MPNLKSQRDDTVSQVRTGNTGLSSVFLILESGSLTGQSAASSVLLQLQRPSIWSTSGLLLSHLWWCCQWYLRTASSLRGHPAAAAAAIRESIKFISGKHDQLWISFEKTSTPADLSLLSLSSVTTATDRHDCWTMTAESFRSKDKNLQTLTSVWTFINQYKN